MIKFHKISKEQMEEDFEKEFEIKLPERGTKLAAGYDFFAPYDITLAPGSVEKIPTGIKVEMPDDMWLGIHPRSNHGFKYALRLLNTVGVIDADYIHSDNEGHIFIKLRNEGDKNLIIKKGEGMAQGIFRKYYLVEGDSFKEGDKRNGGFGSTSVRFV